ncbi:hypothetical protein CC80DRAFT_370983, partial [Byssothecium circinans]
LLTLLNQKLANIPADVLPNLTLADIVTQSRKAIFLPNIPKDIQLPYLLTHRSEITAQYNRALKSPSTQSLTLTRAIFFYRLSPTSTQQFQRYHDANRWNIAIFITLLSLPQSPLATNPYTRTHFPLPARRFVIAYLAAVLEHHNAPIVFAKREHFVRLWKNSAYDFFEQFKPSQKKLLKDAMKRLSLVWERELDVARRCLGCWEYEREVARFVGVLVPGRKD